MGKSLIQTIYAEAGIGFNGKIVFIENYDMSLAKIMVTGVDVWLNLPRRPFEQADLGMKAAANGVLNLSVLDGCGARDLTATMDGPSAKTGILQ